MYVSLVTLCLEVKDRTVDKWRPFAFLHRNPSATPLILCTQSRSGRDHRHCVSVEEEEGELGVIVDSSHLLRYTTFSTGDDDDTTAGVPIKSDWRTFRARLVAAEQISIISANPPETIIPKSNNRWAHPLHTPEKGCLLIASPKLDGVHIFERTVVLLLSLTPNPTGIILNRPSLMSIKETKSTTIDSAGVFSENPLLFGGPVEGGAFPVGSKQVGKSGVFDEVLDGVYYGGKESVGCAAEMVKRNVVGIEEFKFFDGCCGWEKDQLKEEINGGYWSVVECGSAVVERCVGRVGMWEEVVGIVGQRKVW